MSDYKILNTKDISHAGAKRYESTIIAKNSTKGKGRIRSIVVRSMELLKTSSIYRNEITKTAWENKKTNIIWVDVAKNETDIKKVPPKWICQACWIDPELDTQFHVSFKHDEIFEGIMIKWG